MPTKFALRKFKKGDESSLQKHINDKEIYDNTLFIPHPYTKENAEAWIILCSTSKTNFAITVDDEVVGGISFDNIEKGAGELGYWLGKKYWNEGIMTKAVKEMTEYGFKKLKLKKITADVFEWNKASGKVLEKNGYKFIRNVIKTKDEKKIKARKYSIGRALFSKRQQSLSAPK